MDQIWCYKKDQLVSNHIIDKSLILAADLGTNAAKQYTYFNSFSDYIYYIINYDPKHFYELIYDISNYSTYTYIDFDQDLYPETDYKIIENIEDYFDQVIAILIKTFENFVLKLYNTPIKLIIGENIQISYCLSIEKKYKISAHIKINIIFENVEKLKIFINNYIKFLLSNIYTTDEERMYLFYNKRDKKNKITYTSAIDTAVYANFRCFRIIYSSKSTNNLVLLPYKNSSKKIEDHLIIQHNENKQNTINIEISSIDIDIKTDYKKINTFTVKETKTKNIKDTNVTSSMSDSIISAIKQVLTSSSVIYKTFRSNILFDESLFITDSIFRICLKKSANTICPYAQRVHSNNRSYFDYYHNLSIIKYKCYNSNCCNIMKDNCISFKIINNNDAIFRLSDLNSHNTLHCKNELITWNEEYNHYQMFPYPKKSIVAIRAGMGIGKTQMLINEFIPKYCIKENTKCLFITYQILLSRKYDAALEAHGFVNYLDIEKSYKLEYSKIIICLDSLCRVSTSNFDYIFIDEALSVLLHFNSNLIKDVNLICSKFELLLLQAKHIYLLDSSIDNAVVYNFVKYLEHKKNVQSYWIKNNYIRKSNRKCNLLINLNQCNKKVLLVKSIDKINDLLSINKKIVISSSTKSFTEFVYKNITEKYPNKKIFIYNSSTEKKIIEEHSINPQNIWINYDVICYSPTITAGLSFEITHFDDLICYTENTLFTPTVDLVLQQMFRVRQLNSGNMTVFINNYNKYDMEQTPIHENELDNWLQTNILDINQYFPQDSLAVSKASNTIIENSLIQYDTSRLSYSILKGILYNKNKSAHFFPEILIETLKNDYNISCNLQHLITSKDDYDNAISILKQYKNEKNIINLEYIDSIKITMQKYYELSDKIKEKKELTETEKIQKWTYDCAMFLWNISNIDLVDQSFYETYIGSPNISNINKKLELYFCYKRWNDFIKNDLHNNQTRFETKIKELIHNKDYNIELYKTKIIISFEMLIICQKLMTFIFKDYNDYAQDFIISSNDYYESIKKYLKTLSTEEFVKLKKIYNLEKHKTYEDIESLINNQKKLTFFSKHLINKTFGIDLIAKYSHGSKTSIKIFNSKWTQFELKFKTHIIGKYSIIQ